MGLVRKLLSGNRVGIDYISPRKLGIIFHLKHWLMTG